MWFIGVEVEQETSAPPPKKNPGSAPAHCYRNGAAITVLICEQKPYPIWFSCQMKRYPIRSEIV